MEPIIAPIDVNILKAELTPAKKLRDTNKSHNEIYVINHHDSPNVMMEIGRLREEAFRDSGGGSGLSMDIDEFDTMENPYQQLIVWDPEAEKILGGYRYILGPDIKLDSNGQPLLATSHMFHFSEKFIKEYLPYTIELGRSFVAPEYQSSKAGTKALFALDNLWDGLGALCIQRPDMTTSSSAKSNSSSSSDTTFSNFERNSASEVEYPPRICVDASECDARDDEAIISATASACERSILPAKKALTENSPGCAIRAP